MEKLLSILETVKPEINWREEGDLIAKGLLDSIDIINIITELEKEFSVEIGMDYLEVDNFESIGAIQKMLDEIINGNK